MVGLLAYSRPSGTEVSAPVSVSADVSQTEWDAYVAAHPDASAYHRWEWRRVYETAFRHRTVYLAARDAKGAVVGVLPLVAFDHWLFGRFLVSLPFVNYGGVLASSPDVARALVDEAADRANWHRMSHVELRHITPVFDDLPVRRHKVSMAASLPDSVDEAWAGLDRKVRNQVRKAEKSGLTTAAGGAELVDEFYGVFAETMRDLGTPVYPRGWFAEILQRFPHESRVFLVRDGRTPVAGAITLRHRGSLEIPSAASLRAHRATCPNMLLYWSIMRQAVSDGVPVLDFGRSTPGEGTYRFKEQWGARPGPMAWEYVLLSRRRVPDRSPANRRFQPAITLWQRLPLGVANRVGPSVVRYLP